MVAAAAAAPPLGAAASATWLSERWPAPDSLHCSTSGACSAAGDAFSSPPMRESRSSASRPFSCCCGGVWWRCQARSEPTDTEQPRHDRTAAEHRRRRRHGGAAAPAAEGEVALRPPRRPARDHRGRRRVRRAHDHRPARSRSGSSTPTPPNLKKLLVEFVCVATGGPCKYERPRDGGLARRHGARRRRVQRARRGPRRARSTSSRCPRRRRASCSARSARSSRRLSSPADKLHPIDDAKLATVTKLADSLKDKDRGRAPARRGGDRRQARPALVRRAAVQRAPRCSPAARRRSRRSRRCSAPARRTRVTTATKTLKDAGPQADGRRRLGDRRADQEAARPARCTAR